MAGMSSEVPIIQGSKNKREDEEATAATTQRPGMKSQDLGGAMLLDLGLSHRGSTTVSKQGDAKGWRHTAKRGCGPWERQNQCLWGELMPLHCLAQWKVVLLPWQEGSGSHVVRCSSTVPVGAPWAPDCRGPHSPHKGARLCSAGSRAQRCAGGTMTKQACVATPDLAEPPTPAGRSPGWEVAYCRLQLCHSPLFN